VPIGYRNAALLLADLRGTGTSTAAGAAAHTPPLPQSWQGGLPFRYHIGAGPTRARVSVEMQSGQEAYHTIWDTFGILRGTEFPDQMVLVGGHRDAWGPGASDNVSGTVSVLEVAHALAEEARAGHRPKRTIVFATWDAEEWGLVGSTEYVEDDSLRLTRDAVAYLNLDVSAAGPNFGAGGSPSLRAVLRDVTRTVPLPETGGTPRSVFEGWRASASSSDSLGPRFGDPGGGSDFAGFANHLGIPILEYGFGGPGGVYHSAYDDYAWESRFGDPGFVHHATAARIGAALLLRLANADVVPFDYVEYAHTMRRYVTGIDESIKAKGWSTSTAPLATAIDGMERAAAAFSVARDNALGTVRPVSSAVAGTATGGRPAPPTILPAGRSPAPSAAALRATNEALVRVERALTRPAGLRTRPWFRSLIYAADEDNGYANIALPSVAEAIRSGDAALTGREITDLASRFDAAAAALKDAMAALQ
jgi:N-acetylated-alpha-linked acidic dipeptidase